MPYFRNPAFDPQPGDILRNKRNTRRVGAVSDGYVYYIRINDHHVKFHGGATRITMATWSRWAVLAEKLPPYYPQENPYEVSIENSALFREMYNTPIPGDVMERNGQYRRVVAVRDDVVQYRRAKNSEDLDNPHRGTRHQTNHLNWYRWANYATEIRRGDEDEIPEQPLVPPQVGEVLLGPTYVVARVLSIDGDTMTTDGIFDTLTVRQWYDIQDENTHWFVPKFPGAARHPPQSS